jgi:hypothetical protein
MNHFKKMTGLALAVLFLLNTHAFAQREGGTGSHGGDPALINEGQIKNFILNNLRNEITQTVLYVNNHYSEDASYKEMMSSLIDRGLLEDIRLSPFNFQPTCIDYKNRQKAATAKMKDEQGPICWSLPFLSLRKPTASDMIGIGFHEFIHHFGYKDDDHSLAAKFKDSYARRKAGVTQAASVLNGPKLSRISVYCKCEATGDFTEDLVLYQTFSDGSEKTRNLGQFKKSGYTSLGLEESCTHAMKRNAKVCGN